MERVVKLETVFHWVALGVLIVWAMVGTIRLADDFRAWRMGYCSADELRVQNARCVALVSDR